MLKRVPIILLLALVGASLGGCATSDELTTKPLRRGAAPEEGLLTLAKPKSVNTETRATPEKPNATSTLAVDHGSNAPAPPNVRPKNFYVIKEEKDAAFRALRQERGDRSLSEEGTGYVPYQEWVRYWEQKLYPHGDFLIAHDAMRRITKGPLKSAPSSLSGVCGGWTELGPFDRPLGPSKAGVGRVNWINVDPAHPSTVFTGSSKGGLFVSADAGATWHSGGTDFLLPNIGAAHLTVDPTDDDRWFLATGEGDALYHNGWNISHGVYRTSDRGTTWDNIGLDLSQWWGYQIKKLVIAPNDSNTIFAATSFGLYRTSNALDPNPANVTWTLLPTGGNNQNAFYDAEYQPGSTSVLYASGTLLVRSLDGGVTWNPLPGIPFLGPSVLRMAMEVSPANPDFLYVVVVELGPAVCNSNFPSSWLWRFDASSQTWTDKGPICNTGSYGTDQMGVDLGRAQTIAVSPTDANLIYIGDIAPVVKCTTGGAAAACQWIHTANTIHDDIQQIKFTPDGLTIYVASHGGVFKTVDWGATWTSQNDGLAVATVTRMSTATTDPSLMLAGLYDNGTVLAQGGAWRQVYGGDGMTPIIDPIDPSHMYASAQGGPMVRSDNNGSTFQTYVGLPCANFSTFAVVSPLNPATVFGACMPEVLRSTTRGGNWTPISQFASLGNYEVWKIYTAPSNPDYVYAHLITHTSLPQLLVRTTNATAANVTWQAIPHPSTQWISDIDVDETDPAKFWLTYGGFSPATDKVYFYDGTWHNLTTNLAGSDMAVNTIVHERGSDRLFIGTQIGVYAGRGTAPVWARVGGTTAGEMPYVEVTELEINYVNNKLRAGTFGRGMWEIALDSCLPTVRGPEAIIKDSAADVGNEPNTDSGAVLWASDDIWVRNAPDTQFTFAPVPPRYSHEHQHENPEYSPLAINTPYVYVKVHNHGNQPVSGRLRVYRANASTGLDWQLPDWTEILPAIPSTMDVTNLAPGGAWVASVQWTSIPNPQLSVGGHFCLLARFVADLSTPDPIVGEVTGNGVWGNVFYSSKIAWKNVTIVDSFQNRPGGQFIVRDISRGATPRAASATQLQFELATASEPLLQTGAIEVDLGRKLFAVWERGGRKGRGVRVIGPTTIAVREAHASLDNLVLVPREDYVVTVRFVLGPESRRKSDAILHVTQVDLTKRPEAAERIVGGQTFVIRVASRRQK